MIAIARNSRKKRIKICLTCSAGGHFTELTHLKECYSKYDRFFITFKREDTKELEKEEKVYYVDDPKRSVIASLKSFFRSYSILAKERPDVVISTGAGIGVVVCYTAKLFFGSKVIFLESFCRIEEPSLSGKLAVLISDMFFVQWRELLGKYGKKAIYRGAVL